MGQKRNGFRLSKKEDKYVTEVDHPVAQKTENSHKRRNNKGHSKDLEIRQTSPKDVRCIEAYSMKDQFDEIIAEKSSDILDEGVEKRVPSLIITDCEQYQEKTQRRRPTCPPGFSDLPPLLSYNVEKGVSSLTIAETEQDQEINQHRLPTCPPGFTDIPRALINNIDCDGDKARNNTEVVSEARGIVPWGIGGTPRFSYPPTAMEAPTVVAGLQNIIENWRGEYAMGHVGKYSWF